MTLKMNLLAVVLLVTGFASAQIAIRETIRFKDTVKVEKYVPAKNGFSHVKVKMLPGEHTILNPKDVEFLSSQTIIGIDLVYSDYPVGADFSELNRKRILELYILLPQAFNSSIIKWNFVKQTGVEKTGGIQNYYHGFVVYYRPMPTFQEENKAILDVVNGKVAPSDSTLLKVLDRTKTWKDMLVVADVTGSMSPYTAQMLLWIKTNHKLKTFNQIVYFNDNEEASTNQQAALDDRGIWAIESNNSEKVIEKCLLAMKDGNHIENNLEAVCYAIKKYPEHKKNIVMIADNWETPCDMKLLDFLKKEGVVIHVVICGVQERMNTAYLDIAFATGGSVHTMEEDLNEIAKVGEGKIIKLNGMRFKLANGKFVQL